jgi:hypothetical protein
MNTNTLLVAAIAAILVYFAVSLLPLNILLAIVVFLLIISTGYPWGSPRA